MKYLSLDYRWSFNNESYEDDPELELSSQDKLIIESEIEHLKLKGWEIISIDLVYGCVVVVDRIDIDRVPYIKLPPDESICSRSGHICEYCNCLKGKCVEWETCQNGAIAEKAHQERLKEIDARYEKEVLQIKQNFFNNVFGSGCKNEKK